MVDNTYLEFEKRFGRLLDAVLENRLVPFVGAGFSASAESVLAKSVLAESVLKHIGFSPEEPWLCIQLDKLIRRKLIRKKLQLMESSCRGESNLFNQFINNTEDLRKKSDGSLGCLAEIATTLCPSQKDVLRKINIKYLATFFPNRAHRYLAYLVREGLINEVITTNYDPCIEEAYRKSFGDQCLKCQYKRGRQCSFQDQSTSNCENNTCILKVSKTTCFLGEKHCRFFGVIHNLAEYRRYGARRFTKNGKRYPVLRVYKINGCIREYMFSQYCKKSSQYCKKSKKTNEEPRILLSERDLQQFGKEKWAKDLLKDRARSRSLMFVGFGSEEPQVRHNVMTLMEEFQQIYQKNGVPNDIPETILTEKILKRTNAPFMVSYSPMLSFPQVQIMSGFVDAHYQRTENDSSDKLINRINMTYGNTFTGSDVDFFCISSDNQQTNKLDADCFMTRLFQAVFGRLIDRYSAKDSEFYRWLATLTPFPAVWRDLLMKTLYPPDQGQGKKQKQGLNHMLFGSWPELLEPLAGSNTPDIVFSLSKKGMRTEGGGNNGSGQEDGYGPCLLWKWLYAARNSPFKKQKEQKKIQRKQIDPDFYLALRDDSLQILSFLLMISALVQTKEIKIKIVPGTGIEITQEDEKQFLICHMERSIPQLVDKERETMGRNCSQPRFLRIIDFPSATHHCLKGRFYQEEPCRPNEKLKNNVKTGKHVGKDGKSIKFISFFPYIRVPFEAVIKCAKTPEHIHEALERLSRTRRGSKLPEKLSITKI